MADGKTPERRLQEAEGHPIVSIIVVSYNTAQMTVDALRSVYETAGDVDFELFVYDNASTDGSIEAIRMAFPVDAYPDLKLVALDENLGFAAANNRAALHARGRYILLLNPDTLVLPNAIQGLLDFAKRRPKTRIWGARNLLGDGSVDLGSCWGRMTLWSSICFAFGLSKIFSASPIFNPEGYGGWDRTTERSVDIVTGCFFLVDTGLWRELDGFDERFFMYAEEADFCQRARQFGVQPRFTPEVEIIHYGAASEALRAKRMTKTISGKITLAKKHWPRWQLWLLRQLYKVAVLIRWSGYGMVARLGGKPHHREVSAEWKAIWRMRNIWVHGY